LKTKELDAAKEGFKNYTQEIKGQIHCDKEAEF